MPKGVDHFEVLDYLTEDGHDPFTEWLANLVDRQARAKVAVRVQRMATGNFGDHKPLTEGVWELRMDHGPGYRMDHGPGYRVYYARSGRQVLLLLAGGDKRHQQANIETAVHYWRDWQRRNTS